MLLARRFRELVLSHLRALPLAQHAWARYRARAYERSVAQFTRDGSGRAEALPRGIVYEATMRCNLHCEFCYVGDLLNIEGEWRQELSIDELQRAFPDGTGVQVNLTGGEIFMRKDIMDVLALFGEKGYTCGYLTTNGTIITDERAEALARLAQTGFLRHISVSIDGPGEHHDRARGQKGTFERTAAGLRRLQDAARRLGAPLRVSINTTVAAESLSTLEQMVDVAEELGIDAIGLNHLMYATPEEAAETARLLDSDVSVISTYVTPDPLMPPDQVRAHVAAPSRQVSRTRHSIRHPAQGVPRADRGVLHARHGVGRPVPVSVPARARVVQRQGVFLPVHPHRGRRPHEVDARGDLERRALRRAPAPSASAQAVPGVPALLQGRAVADGRTGAGCGACQARDSARAGFVIRCR